MTLDVLWFCGRCRRALRNDPALKPRPAVDTVTAQVATDGTVHVTHDQCRGSVAFSVRSAKV